MEFKECAGFCSASYILLLLLDYSMYSSNTAVLIVIAYNLHIFTNITDTNCSEIGTCSPGENEYRVYIFLKT